MHRRALFVASWLLLAPVSSAARADIYRWDTGQLIPGTEHITPRPWVSLTRWNTENRNLRFADFSGGLDLSSSGLDRSWLDNADFSRANLSDASFEYSTLTNANLSGANLTNARFFQATLTNASLSGAVVQGASFYDTTSRGFTRGQLESTASYQAKDLRDIWFSRNDLSGWDFRGQNLANANFDQSTLTNADLSGAVVQGVSFTESRGFTRGQLESTASYQAKDLQGIGLVGNDLTDWDFHGQNLANASVYHSILTDANLSGAVVQGANFNGGTSRGFTRGQLESTASYQAKDLQGIGLADNDLTGWDFREQNLANASIYHSILTNANLSGANLANVHFSGSTLTNANLSGAVVQGASFFEATSSGFTRSQLESTASYQAKDLQDVRFTGNDLTGWDFHGQNLANARFDRSTLTNANLAGANLAYANFSDSDLADVNLSEAYLANARFDQSTLTNANLSGAQLAHARFNSSTLTNANFTGASLANVVFDSSTLTDANLRGAVVRGASFYEATSSGFTRGQLESTASYQAKDLRDIWFSRNDLSGWDFRGQNLANASFDRSTLTNADLSGANLADSSFLQSTLIDANLSGAIVQGASFYGVTSRGFTRGQLESTASYRAKDLQGIVLDLNDLSGWDFRGQNLANVSFFQSTLTNANLSGAVVRGVNFRETTSHGFTRGQLESTASYQAKDLEGIGLLQNDLTGWDFHGQNLANAIFNSSTLTNANLSGAIVQGVSFAETTSRGFTRGQLESTASYQAKDLKDIDLRNNDLTGWDFRGQNLANASFYQSTLTEANLSGAQLANAFFAQSTLTNANLAGAQLANARLDYSTLTNANLSGAVVQGVRFTETTSRGFTRGQLESTASYQAKDLQGIDLSRNDLSGWDFRGQNLANASFFYSTLTDANLSQANLTNADLRWASLDGVVIGGAVLYGADLRDSHGLTLDPAAQSRNVILPNGEIDGLDVRAGESLRLATVWLRRAEYAAPSVRDSFSIEPGGVLSLVPYEPFVISPVTFAEVTSIDLGGTLQLSIPDYWSPRYLSPRGNTYQLFAWPGPLDPSNRFDAVVGPPGTVIDTANLYTTGEVTLFAVPEPTALLLAALLMGLASSPLRRGEGAAPASAGQ